MGSLIDKGKVVDKIQDLFLDKYEEKANNDFTGFFKEVLKILVNDKGQPWISVKDRLPERGTVGRYLAYVENIANYHRLPDNIIIATWFMSDWDFAQWEYNRVAYWMPLPSTEGLDDNR